VKNGRLTQRRTATSLDGEMAPQAQLRSCVAHLNQTNEGGALSFAPQL
jgi:hypothetical protein